MKERRTVFVWIFIEIVSVFVIYQEKNV